MKKNEVERLRVEPSYILSEQRGNAKVVVVLYGPVTPERIEKAHREAKHRAHQLDV